MKEKYYSLTTDSYYLRNRKIVIIHKNRPILEPVVVALEKNEAEVTYFDNPKDGLKHLLKNKADVAISDMTMKDMDGLELLKKLKVVRKTPVIFLTKCDTLQIVSDAYNLGCADYIYEKKASLRDIINSIKYTIRGNTIEKGFEWQEAVDLFGNEDLLFKELKAGPHAESYVLYYNAERSFAEKDYESALFLYKKAYEAGLKKVRLYMMLGITNHFLENYDEAEKWLKKAVKVDPNNLWILRGLVGLYKKVGDEKKEEEYQRRENRARFIHPSKYILNQFKVNIKYLEGVKLLFITSHKKRLKLYIDGLKIAGAEVDVVSKYPTKKDVKKGGYNFIVLDIDSSRKGLFKFVRRVKSLKIPTFSISQYTSQSVVDELESCDVYHLNINLYNAGGLIEGVAVKRGR
jgi:two-component system response regulator ResD